MPGAVIVKTVGTASGHVQATFLERLTEWLFAAQLLSWGLILLRPEDTFSLSRAMMPLERIASENAWGWYAVAVGTVRLIALFINGWVVPHTYLFRLGCCFLSILAWLTISLGSMDAGTASTALGIYPWIALAEMVCLWRIGRDYANWRDIHALEEG